ncbi:hypothetical protein CR513_35355, partial [Mucuna pruriens]
MSRVRIVRKTDNILLSKRNYIEKLLKKFGYYDLKSISTAYDVNFEIKKNRENFIISRLGLSLERVKFLYFNNLVEKRLLACLFKTHEIFEIMVLSIVDFPLFKRYINVNYIFLIHMRQNPLIIMFTHGDVVIENGIKVHSHRDVGWLENLLANISLGMKHANA